MGLDMYLRKNTYIGSNYEHNKVSGVIEIEKDGKEIQIQFNRVSEIIEEVGYWRKANHIHKWFIENGGGGFDECGTIDISINELEALLDVCKKVIVDKDLASELLPTMSGFFFGSTEYDEYYFNVIGYTIKLIESILKEDNENSTFYYSSSW